MTSADAAARQTTYHTTDASEAIVAGGFRDGEGSYGCATWTLRCVFLGDSPLDVNEGAAGAEVLEVTLPADVDLAEYELVEDRKPYREWCVPATVINRHGTIRLLTEQELDDLLTSSWTVRGGKGLQGHRGAL